MVFTTIINEVNSGIRLEASTDLKDVLYFAAPVPCEPNAAFPRDMSKLVQHFTRQWILKKGFKIGKALLFFMLKVYRHLNDPDEMYVHCTVITSHNPITTDTFEVPSFYVVDYAHDHDERPKELLLHKGEELMATYLCFSVDLTMSSSNDIPQSSSNDN